MNETSNKKTQQRIVIGSRENDWIAFPSQSIESVYAISDDKWLVIGLAGAYLLNPKGAIISQLRDITTEVLKETNL